MIITAGEALVDLVPDPVPGGGPMNTAVACARLDVPTAFLGAVSTDEHGDAIWAHLEASGVDLRLTQRRDEPTCRAEVVGDPPVFHFHGDGTADRFIEAPDPDLLDGGPHLFHGGTLGIFREPGAEVIATVAEEIDGIVSFDPNARPQIVEPLGRGVWDPWFDRWVAACSLFRGSDDDFAWIWPDRDPADAAAELLDRGVVAVMITSGTSVSIVTAEGTASVAVTPVPVVDTVGAGDSFCGGVLVALYEREILTPGALAAVSLAEWREIVAFGTRVAGVTVQRVGADPPRRHELPT